MGRDKITPQGGEGMTSNRPWLEYAKINRRVWDAINQLEQPAQRCKAAYAYLEWFFEGEIADEGRLPKAVRIILPHLKNEADGIANSVKGGVNSAKAARDRGRFNCESSKERGETQGVSSENLPETYEFSKMVSEQVSSTEQGHDVGKLVTGLANRLTTPSKSTNTRNRPDETKPDQTRPEPVASWCPWMSKEGDDGRMFLDVFLPDDCRQKDIPKYIHPTRLEALETSYEGRTSKKNFNAFMGRYVRGDACESCYGSCVDTCFNAVRDGIKSWDRSKAATPGPLVKKILDNSFE